MKKFNTEKLYYGKYVDKCLRIIFYPFTKRKQQKPLSQIFPHTILVLEFHLIGDIIMSIPALHALRKKYPHSKIVLVAGKWAKDLLEKQNLVDEIVVFSCPWSTYNYSLSNLWQLLKTLLYLRKMTWDVGIDMRGDLRNLLFLFFTKAKRRVSYNFTGGEYLLTDVIEAREDLQHIVEYRLHLVKQLGCSIEEKTPFLAVENTDLEKAKEILFFKEKKKYLIGIHPGASNPLRLWKPEYFAELSTLLLKRNDIEVVFFYGQKDIDIIENIKKYSKNSSMFISQPLSLLPALFKLCNIVVGLDSGAVHIASAVGTPTIVLFGPQNPEYTKPYSSNTTIVIKDGYECRPCNQDKCIQPLNNCMDAIDVNIIYNTIIKKMENNYAQ